MDVLFIKLKLEVVMLSIKFDVVFVDGNSVVIVGD